MAWGSWAWWRSNTARQHKWLAAIDGVAERSAHIATRRALINHWSQHGYNPQVQQNRRRRAQRQAKRARKAYQTNKTKVNNFGFIYSLYGTVFPFPINQ
eukprot:14337538-Ditylum_brightwellii.AAC.1